MYQIFNDLVDITDLMDEAEATTSSFETHGSVADPERLAGMALELARLHDHVLDVLEPLKEALRSVAREQLDAFPGVVELDGRNEEDEFLGRVTVTFPATTVKLNKGTDVDRLRRTLGARFTDYFAPTTSYAPVPDFKARTTAALRTPEAAAEVRVAMASVKVVEPTPRVGFKPSVGKEDR